MTDTHRLGEPADDWRIDTLDLDAYLDRIGQPHAQASGPSAPALRELHAAHVRAIPFDNVEPALGITPRLDLESISGKLVRHGRGGYCYEHGLLFAAALERLGYDVTRLAARVQRPGPRGPKTHLCLAVRVDGQAHLADVGFGRGILYPMPLEDGAIVDQAGWKHRVIRDGEYWWLEKRTGEGWLSQHVFDETPQYLADYQVSNHYVATHPDSPFSGGGLVVMRVDDGVARRLVRDTLTTEYADGRVEKSTVPTERLGETLRGLGVEVTPAELADLRATHATLAQAQEV